jgi:hypothetical protein
MNTLRKVFLTPKSPKGDISFVAELLYVIHIKILKNYKKLK